MQGDDRPGLLEETPLIVAIMLTGEFSPPIWFDMNTRLAMSVTFNGDTHTSRFPHILEYHNLTAKQLIPEGVITLMRRQLAEGVARKLARRQKGVF